MEMDDTEGFWQRQRGGKGGDEAVGILGYKRWNWRSFSVFRADSLWYPLGIPLRFASCATRSSGADDLYLVYGSLALSHVVPRSPRLQDRF